MSAVSGAAFILLALQGAAEEWTTYQHDPARTGHSPVRVEPPYREAWIWADGDLYDGRPIPEPRTWFSRRAQPVTDGRRVFIGSLSSGRLYGIDLETGRTVWAYDAGMPMLEAASVSGGTVFVGDAGGTLHAVEAATGRRRWAFDEGRAGGFMACPAVAEGRVFLGSRSGHLFALDAASGRKLWEFDAGDSILNTPAVHEGSVLFGDEGMQVARLSASDGRVLWRKRVPGFTFRHGAPVVVASKGVVVLRNSPVLNEGAGALLDRAITFDPKDRRAQVSEAEMAQLAKEFRTGKEPPGGFEEAQRVAQDFLKGHPEARSAFVLDLADGSERVLAPFGYQAQHADACPEPVAFPDGRLLGYTRGRWGSMVGVIFSSKYMMDIGWLDFESGRFRRMAPHRSIDPAPFAIRADDCARLSAGGDILYGNHGEWGRSHERGVGALDLRTMKSWPLGGPEARADRKDPLAKIGQPRTGNGICGVAVTSNGTLLINYLGKALVAVRSVPKESP